MAYFTGTANNPADLLLKLKSHAESIGWITDRSVSDEWCCHNAGGFWSIKAFADRWELCGNTGFQGGVAWDNQPGSSAYVSGSYRYNTVLALTTTPFVAYHLFATADYLHLVTEVASGQFRPFFIGTLDKRGAVYDGGQYVSGFRGYSNGSHPSHYAVNNSSAYYPFTDETSDYYPGLSSKVRVDNQDGSPSPTWFAFSRDYSNYRVMGLGRGYASYYHPSAMLVETSANALTGGTLLIPCTIYTVGAENRTRMIGEVPDFRVCRMDYLSAGDTVVVGSEQWRVFPPIERTASDSQGSGMVGYAYKVVA